MRLVRVKLVKTLPVFQMAALCHSPADIVRESVALHLGQRLVGSIFLIPVILKCMSCAISL